MSRIYRVYNTYINLNHGDPPAYKSSLLDAVDPTLAWELGGPEA